MPRIRIGSVKAEWMNDWFTADAETVAFRPTFTREVNDTAETAGRLAAMVTAIDPDVVAIEEGPSRPAELQLFVDDYLAGGFGSFLGDSGGAQKLGLLSKPTRSRRRASRRTATSKTSSIRGRPTSTATRSSTSTTSRATRSSST
jgi:hypothetical protein